MNRALAFVVHAALLGGALYACEREQIEIAETGEQDPFDAGSAADVVTDGNMATPMFPEVDAAPACGPAPPLTACQECPNEHVWVDGKPTCECCP